MFYTYWSHDISLCNVSIHSLSPDVCFSDVSDNFAVGRDSKIQRKKESIYAPVSPSFISYPRIFMGI